MTSQKAQRTKKCKTNKSCENCGVTDSPAWRRHNKKLLCNKCGLYAQRNKRDRPIGTSKTAKRAPSAKRAQKNKMTDVPDNMSSPSTSTSTNMVPHYHHAHHQQQMPQLPMQYASPPHAHHQQQTTQHHHPAHHPSTPHPFVSLGVPPLLQRKLLKSHDAHSVYHTPMSTNSSRTESATSDHQISTPMSVDSSLSFNGGEYFNMHPQVGTPPALPASAQHHAHSPVNSNVAQYPSSASSMESVGSNFAAGAQYFAPPMQRSPLVQHASGAHHQYNQSYTPTSLLPKFTAHFARVVAPDNYSPATPPASADFNPFHVTFPHTAEPSSPHHFNPHGHMIPVSTPSGVLPSPYTLSYVAERIPFLHMTAEPQMSREWGAPLGREQHHQSSGQAQQHSGSRSTQQQECAQENLQMTPQKHIARLSSISSPLVMRQQETSSPNLSTSTTTSTQYARKYDSPRLQELMNHAA